MGTHEKQKNKGVRDARLEQPRELLSHVAVERGALAEHADDLVRGGGRRMRALDQSLACECRVVCVARRLWNAERRRARAVFGARSLRDNNKNENSHSPCRPDAKENNGDGSDAQR